MFSNYILSGPESNTVFQGSLGSIIYKSLREKNADNVAAIDAYTKKAITFRAIYLWSKKLANYLKQEGIEKDDIISIISENSIYYSVPVIAALFIGAILYPLNSGYTVNELKDAYLISKPKVIFCSESCLKKGLELKGQLSFIKAVIVITSNNNLLDMEKLISSMSEEIELSKFDSDEQVAFILLSSGTTGLPKGVMLTHKNMCFPLNYMNDESMYGMSSSESTILIAPSFHIFGLFTTLSAIIFSMRLVIMEKFKPDVFLKTIGEHKVTQLYLAAPTLIFLAKSRLVDNYDLSSVRRIFYGAMTCDKEIEAIVRRRLNLTCIQQSYGLTELVGPCLSIRKNIYKPGSVGTLLPNIKAKVWDSVSKKNLGSHKVGELCFKGPAVMRGYVGDLKAIKETIDDDGFLHTGDAGYYDEDNFFYIVDRLKDIIKYKGFQISPAEIEAVLLKHVAVKEAAVIGIPDDRTGELPLAFVVKKMGFNVTAEEIINFVADNISINKRLYGGVRFVDEIPIGPNGKKLRKILRCIATGESKSQ